MEGKQFSDEPRRRQILVGDFLEPLRRRPAPLLPHAPGPETQDTDFTWAEFVRRNNDELVATWGNLVNRTLQSAYKNFGVVPSPARSRPRTRRCSRAVEGGFESVGALIEQARFRAALAEAMRLASPRQPVRQRAGAVGAARDATASGPGRSSTSRSRASTTSRRCSRRSCRSQLAGAARDCSATTASIAGPLEFRDVDEGDGTVHTRARPATTRAGSGAGSRAALPAGQELREPAAAVPQARPGHGRGRGARSGWSRPPTA